MNQELIYKVAITLIPGIGDVHGKKLVAYCGGVEAVFREKRQALLKIPGVGEALTRGILRRDYLERAEKEVKFLQRYRVTPLFYLDDGYPARLKHCEDGPMMLYVMGKVMPERSQVLSIVGTRRPTAYGQEMTQQIVAGMAGLDVLIVSGLAYGIDTAAHRASLTAGLPTAAVLAHGLDNLYPFVNKPLAEKIMCDGCLVTEFPSGTKLNKEYFPRRNRVIAGLADATLVVESAEKGGALITAEIALSYNRDVLAVPGRAGDPKSSGCNRLIKSNKAALVESPDDIRIQMNWDQEPARHAVQHRLFTDLNEEEKIIWAILTEKKEADIDEIYLKSGFTASKVAAILLKLEFDGLVACFPGKRYKAL